MNKWWIGFACTANVFLSLLLVALGLTHSEWVTVFIGMLWLFAALILLIEVNE